MKIEWSRIRSWQALEALQGQRGCLESRRHMSQPRTRRSRPCGRRSTAGGWRQAGLWDACWSPAALPADCTSIISGRKRRRIAAQKAAQKAAEKRAAAGAKAQPARVQPVSAQSGDKISAATTRKASATSDSADAQDEDLLATVDNDVSRAGSGGDGAAGANDGRQRNAVRIRDTDKREGEKRSLVKTRGGEIDEDVMKTVRLVLAVAGVLMAGGWACAQGPRRYQGTMGPGGSGSIGLLWSAAFGGAGAHGQFWNNPNIVTTAERSLTISARRWTGFCRTIKFEADRPASQSAKRPSSTMGPLMKADTAGPERRLRRKSTRS